MAPHVHVVVADAYAVRGGAVVEEVIEGTLDGGGELCDGQAHVWVVETVRERRPLRGAFAAQGLRVEVLVVLEEGGDAVGVKRLDGLLDLREVRVVVLARLRLDGGPAYA